MYVDIIIIIAFCKTSITNGKSWYEMGILLDVCIRSLRDAQLIENNTFLNPFPGVQLFSLNGLAFNFSTIHLLCIQQFEQNNMRNVFA